METNIHFTYRAVGCDSDLLQGDLLKRTPAIEGLLKDVHPHYFNNKTYRYFLVLTQSCDLVRRQKSTCKSRYITLCGVRPAQIAIQRKLQSFQSKFEEIAGVCRQSRRDLIEDFLRSLLNNNEPSYFYLHEEPALELHEPHCAFLPLSVAVRAGEHYEKCLEARAASLDDVFQAKLGWLVGNMYSRVGTRDWVPTVEADDSFDSRIARIVDGLCRWEDDKRVEAARKNDAAKSATLTKSEAEELLKGVQVRSRRQRILESLERVLKNEALLKDAALKSSSFEIVKRSLASDSDFQNASSG